MQQPNCRTLTALAACFILTGCKQGAVARKPVSAPPTVSLSEANRVAAYAERGMSELAKRGVAIGKLEAYGNTQPVANEGRNLQGFSLHYSARYDSRPVVVDAWIELVTANGRERLTRGQVCVSDAESEEFIKVAL